MTRIVVIDSSPLIGLAIVDGLKWLPELFPTLFLPESVKQEVLPGKAARGEEAIALALDAGRLKAWPEPIAPLLDVDLDKGETDCINLGLSHADEVLLIMDERTGRAVAKEKGLRVIGTAAIIGLAKKQGLIASFDPLTPALSRRARERMRRNLKCESYIMRKHSITSFNL